MELNEYYPTSPKRGVFPGLWSTYQDWFKENWLSLFPQISNAESSSARGDRQAHLPAPRWDFVSLSLQGSCSRSHNPCEFICAAALFCPENSVS